MSLVRLKASLAWRHLRLAGRIGARSGYAARRVRWPIDSWAPYRRSRLEVSRGEALGDVLMCTPALRELKRVNPGCNVTFYTRYRTILEGLPFIDEIRGHEDRPVHAIDLTYEFSVPPRRHIASILGDNLGLCIRDVRPDCYVDAGLVNQYKQAWKDCPRPWVVVNRKAGPWTPNKDWPEVYWRELIDRLTLQGTVIEIGSVRSASVASHPGNYINVAGETLPEQLVAVLAAADLHVGPISGPVHIAAAVRTPSVVIYGGYENPVCSSYPGNINLFTPLTCSPCWLREPCPIGKLCLWKITLPSVIEAVVRLWNCVSGKECHSCFKHG